MRIIGGTARGRPLASPHDRDIRPTTDRVREAWFNLLAHGTPPLPRAARVLDVFAGTGALGCEALSRGAAWCGFLERSPAALRLIEQNLASLDLADRAQVFRCDARYPPIAQAPVDLILMDSPYNSKFIIPTIDALIKHLWIEYHTVIWVELSVRENGPICDFLSIDREKIYGDSRLIELSLVE